MPPLIGGPGGLIGILVPTGGIDYAVTLSPTRVRVHFDTPPMKRGGTMAGDAQDPQRWEITPDNFTPPAGDPGWQVVDVLEDDPSDPNTIVLATIRPLRQPVSPEPMVVFPKFEIEAIGVLASGGGEFDNAFATVNGMFPVPPPRSSPILTIGSDLANPSAMSGLQIGQDGDVALESGLALLRKLIIRRVITPRGRLLHAPSYGALPPIKGLIRPNDLPDLQKQLQNEVLSQPGVIAAAVTAAQDGGIVTITVRARTESGTESTVSVQVEA